MEKHDFVPVSFEEAISSLGQEVWALWLSWRFSRPGSFSVEEVELYLIPRILRNYMLVLQYWHLLLCVP